MRPVASKGGQEYGWVRQKIVKAFTEPLLGGRERHAEMSAGGFQQLQVMKKFSGEKATLLQRQPCTESACRSK